MSIPYNNDERARLIKEVREDDELLPPAPWADWPGQQGRPSFPRIRCPSKVYGTDPVLTVDSFGDPKVIAYALARVRNNLRAMAAQLEVVDVQYGDALLRKQHCELALALGASSDTPWIEMIKSVVLLARK